MSNAAVLAPVHLSGAEVAEQTISNLLPLLKSERILELARQAIIDRNAMGSAPWEVATLEGEIAKPMIEVRSGIAHSTDAVADLLSVSDETVRNMLKRDELIAYPALRGKGNRFPAWQFDTSTRTARVHPWVKEILAAYGHNGWGLLDFLTVPRIPDGGLNYLSKFQRGAEGVAEVIAAARRSNPD